MGDNADKVRKLLRQQAAIAGFGSFALRQNDLLKVLNEAARVCAEGLEVPFSKICRFRTVEKNLIIEAGYGWRAGVVGTVEGADTTSPQGRAFVTGEPAIFNDLRNSDHKLDLPSFYTDHGIVSIVDVVIHAKNDDQPYGVLEIDNDVQHDYDQHDIDFLTGFANVLAEAVATSVRTALLQVTIEKMKVLVGDKDRLIDQKSAMAEELQHRVRNNLQLVYSMLNKQLDDTTDEAGRRGIKGIARRVSTLAQVYEHLLGAGMNRTTDFDGYMKSLCVDLAEIQATRGNGITLTYHGDELMLDLDTVTALGIVVAELVTNSYDHAFADVGGNISVSLRRPIGEDDLASIIISDTGKGFKAGAETKRHGVGLVRRLVEQVRGTAAVNSDRGTVWTVKFPVQQSAGRESAAAITLV